MKNTLIIITGPTAVGKTAMAVRLAKHLRTSVINADSRQVFREMIIGTAVPSFEEQSAVKHYFLGHRSIHEGYNASMFENNVIGFLDKWFQDHNTIVMVGGSGLYIDAVCHGIDDLPTIDPAIRKKIRKEFDTSGLEGIRNRLKGVDPEYYQRVDPNNPMRIMKALEVAEMTGRPYTSFLKGQSKERNFRTVMIGLDLPRKELHERINRRVDEMIGKGLIDEAASLYIHRHQNALNTVGYKEIFDQISGKCTLTEAIEKIKAHTRQYARRQLTWFRRYPDIKWFGAGDFEGIKEFLSYKLQATS